MNPKEQTKISKKMSYHLRHHPEELGITLDTEGWTDIHIFIEKLQAKGVPIDLDILEEVVREDKKGRYATRVRHDEHGEFVVGSWQIRANQGHSTDKVDINFPVAAPDSVLYHGTCASAWEKIASEGLLPMTRHAVHLTKSIQTAKETGSRWREKVVIIEVDAERMHKLGFVFYVSDNNVWLTDKIPPQFLKKKDN